ncbi:320_t:CDS:2, partial [Dentiscutata erythropus]
SQNLNEIKVQKHPKFSWTVNAKLVIFYDKDDISDIRINFYLIKKLANSETLSTFRVFGVVAVGAHSAKTSSGIMPDQLCSMKIVNAAKANLENEWLNNSQNIKNLLRSSD